MHPLQVCDVCLIRKAWGILRLTKLFSRLCCLFLHSRYSCYPSGLLGIAPSWYKSREFRSRAVREPRRVLADDFGLDVSGKATVRVHDSTADHRYLVLPTRPAGTEGWSKDDLRTLVTRDTMIGVAEPKIG